jgi:HrpA-like RNA helicase
LKYFIFKKDSNKFGILSKESSGSILIFLPGLNEIMNFIDLINERFKNETHFLEIIPLHSSLSETNINSLFITRSSRKRKIIVATNIAESSITVPDVVFVIDFCLVK